MTQKKLRTLRIIGWILFFVLLLFNISTFFLTRKTVRPEVTKTALEQASDTTEAHTNMQLVNDSYRIYDTIRSFTSVGFVLTVIGLLALHSIHIKKPSYPC